MNSAEFIRRLDAIPNLLEMARSLERLNYYPLQDALREQHRQAGLPFLYTMPMRHFDTCPVCGMKETCLAHTLEDPRRKAEIHFTGMDVHQSREHEIEPRADLAEFLLAFEAE